MNQFVAIAKQLIPNSFKDEVEPIKVIHNLSFNTLNNNTDKKVIFKSTKYKIKRVVSKDETTFYLQNVKYSNYEIECPFKHR